MTTKIVTSLIAGALLSGSAAASLQAANASLASAQISDGCYSRTQSTTSDGSPAFVVVPPIRAFAASADAFAQRAPRVILLKPLTPSIQ
jgi:hypothetical protein